MKLYTKQTITLLLSALLACPLAASCTPEGTAPYYVRSPYNEEDTQIGKFDSLRKARECADENTQYGYAVFDSNGDFIYAPGKTLRSAIMIYEAKKIADHIRDKHYTYGHASINPAMDWDSEKPEKIVSCDRLVGWILYNAGFREGQPEAHGLTSDMIPFLRENGFTEIKDPDDLLPGDIIYVGYEGQPEPYGHVFLHAGEDKETGMCYRYDAGSNERIWCTKGTEAVEFEQPFLEPLSQGTNRIFITAFRAPEIEE